MDTRPRSHPLPDMWSSVLDSKKKTSLQVRGRETGRWGGREGEGERKRGGGREGERELVLLQSTL